MTFWIKHRFLHKNYFISQHSHLWALYTSSNVSQSLLSLPKYKICRGPQNRYLFVRDDFIIGVKCFLPNHFLKFRKENHSGLNSKNRGVGGAICSPIHKIPPWRQNMCALSLWKRILFLAKCSPLFFKSSFNWSNMLS